MPPHCVGGNATIKRSSITEGCNIYGTVIHSVIFAGVDIEEGAEVVDSVVMPGAVIRSGAKVHRAIIEYFSYRRYNPHSQRYRDRGGQESSRRHDS